jgi:ATP-dependent DNA helicase DinG
MKKGIIHTTSYTQLHFIEDNLSKENLRRLIHSDPNGGLERPEIIEEHTKSKKPTVLISPSFNTGLDLKDDFARFQIIVKVPYPNRGDRWTEAKRKKDPAWYNWKTALTLIQSYGRAVRSKDDWAKTYVLDGAFDNFIRNKYDKLPKWFTSCIYKGLK